MKSQVFSFPAAPVASGENNPPKVSIISNKTTYTWDWNLILTDEEVTTGSTIPNKKMKFTIQGEQFSLDCRFICQPLAVNVIILSTSSTTGNA